LLGSRQRRDLSGLVDNDRCGMSPPAGQEDEARPEVDVDAGNERPDRKKSRPSGPVAWPPDRSRP
jgi:hypothetical protein